MKGTAMKISRKIKNLKPGAVFKVRAIMLSEAQRARILDDIVAAIASGKIAPPDGWEVCCVDVEMYVDLHLMHSPRKAKP